jgi:hypothetical protein
LICFFALLTSGSLAQQKTTNTTTAQCSPILGDNHGHVNIHCSGLTKEQQDILANVPKLLNQVLAKQLTTADAKKLFKGMSDQLADIKNGLQQLQDRPADPNRGILAPANEPNPVNANYNCEAKAAGKFRLYLGSFMITSPGLRETAIWLAGKEVLGFTRHDGNIGINASVNDPEGKQIVFVKDGYFSLGEYFRKELDRSTLNVYNQTDDTPVLHIKYLNENAIQITGKFYNGKASLDITNDSFQITTSGGNINTLTGGCMSAAADGMPTGLAMLYVY